MKLIQRLYLKDFFTLFCLILIGMTILFSIIDLIDRIDSFIPGEAFAGNLVRYALYSMPRFLTYLLPMSILVCSFFIFSQAMRRHELTSVKAAGGKLKKLFSPFLIVGLFLTVFAFFNGEFIVPEFSKRAIELKNMLKGKRKKVTFFQGSLWLKGKDGSPVKIGIYNVTNKTARDIDIFHLGEDFLSERIRAESGHWNGKTWVLENVSRYHSGSGEIERMKTLSYPYLEPPDLFDDMIKKTDEMGIYELYRYTDKLSKAGLSNTKLIVDLHKKASLYLINFFMIMLGMSLSTRARIGGGLFSAGLALLISLVYWFAYTFTLSMGYAGILPPLVAAWMVPALFGFFSVSLFVKMPE